MTENMNKQHIKELKQMIQEKKNEEPVEKILVKFCARHGVSLDTRRIHYHHLVEKGEIKKTPLSSQENLKRDPNKPEATSRKTRSIAH